MSKKPYVNQRTTPYGWLGAMAAAMDRHFPGKSTGLGYYGFGFGYTAPSEATLRERAMLKAAWDAAMKAAQP